MIHSKIISSIFVEKIRISKEYCSEQQSKLKKFNLLFNS